MIPRLKVFAMTVLFLAFYCNLGVGQVPPLAILQIDLENHVQYYQDISDASKFATDPNITAAAIPRNFGTYLIVGDIVAVNGRPAKGTATSYQHTINLRPAPNPGNAIADTNRNSLTDIFNFEILNVDGTQIGTIMALGLGGGDAAPGAPSVITQGNNAIVGGTGAYLGARGFFGQAVTPQTIPARRASMLEDPANRRKNGGGRLRFVLQVIPLFRPEALVTDDGPAVYHADSFNLVTPKDPARPGEVLTIFATGLGPTRPGIDPGELFPSNPPHVVNSPVEVTVSGFPVKLLSATGVPFTNDRYQITFEVPPGTAQGWATVQITAAWIPGTPITVLVVPR
ncbi:MAG TPA: hypothetical protein VGQ81_08745 [Acidobacteriota bacterium]|jgi:hypothetical protein|nr:hypothetical protein [Acidobacteriota bacterium]